MDTADFRVVSSKQYCGEQPPLKTSYGYQFQSLLLREQESFAPAVRF